jgi:hypothetical protein
LLAAGAPLPSSSPTPLTPTPAEATLARTVGGSLVGFGNNACFSADQVGIVPDVNVAFGVKEIAVYDPLLPKSYYSSWRSATGATGEAQQSAAVPFSLFCPAVTSVSSAREYGISYILEPPRSSGPQGTTLVEKISGEGLYRVPGASRATLVPLSGSQTLPPVDAPGTSVGVSQPGPASWRMDTSARVSSVLRLRLTDVPGWHATVDGRSVRLEKYAGVMLQVKVPAGHHVVVLRYWPDAFSFGLAIALVAVVVLLALAVVGAVSVVRSRVR